MTDAQNDAREAFATGERLNGAVDWPAQMAAWTRAHDQERSRERVARLERYESKIAAAYFAVAALADRCGLFEHPQVQRALDCFAFPDAPEGEWMLDESTLQPGTEWEGEPATHLAPVDVAAYWG